jgi:hypothetical protein
MRCIARLKVFYKFRFANLACKRLDRRAAPTMERDVFEVRDITPFTIQTHR